MLESSTIPLNQWSDKHGGNISICFQFHQPLNQWNSSRLNQMYFIFDGTFFLTKTFVHGITQSPKMWKKKLCFSKAVARIKPIQIFRPRRLSALIVSINRSICCGCYVVYFRDKLS